MQTCNKNIKFIFACKMLIKMMRYDDREKSGKKTAVDGMATRL